MTTRPRKGSSAAFDSLLQDLDETTLGVVESNKGVASHGSTSTRPLAIIPPRIPDASAFRISTPSFSPLLPSSSIDSPSPISFQLPPPPVPFAMEGVLGTRKASFTSSINAPKSSPNTVSFAEQLEKSPPLMTRTLSGASEPSYSHKSDASPTAIQQSAPVNKTLPKSILKNANERSPYSSIDALNSTMESYMESEKDDDDEVDDKEEAYSESSPTSFHADSDSGSSYVSGDSSEDESDADVPPIPLATLNYYRNKSSSLKFSSPRLSEQLSPSLQSNQYELDTPLTKELSRFLSEDSASSTIFKRTSSSASTVTKSRNTGAESSDDEPLISTTAPTASRESWARKGARRSVNSAALFSVRVYFESERAFLTLDAPLDINAAQFIEMLLKQDSLAHLALKSATSFVLYETCPELCIERPIREWEQIAPIVVAYPLGSYISLVHVADVAYLDTTLCIEQLKGRFPIAQGKLHLDMTGMGNWKWVFSLVDNGSLMVFQDGKKSGMSFLYLSGYEIFSKMRRNDHLEYERMPKTPTAFWFALRATNPISFFQDKSQYCRYVCCEKGSRVLEWITSLQLLKCELLVKEAPALFEGFPKVEALIRSLTLKREAYVATLAAPNPSAASERVVPVSRNRPSSSSRPSERRSARRSGSSSVTQASSKPTQGPLITFQNSNSLANDPAFLEQRRQTEKRRIEVKRGTKALIDYVGEKK